MSRKLVKKFTCDFCGKSSKEFEVCPCDADDFWPNGWGTLFYDFTDEKGNAKGCTLDICEKCLADDETHVVIYPNKMRKHMYEHDCR